MFSNEPYIFFEFVECFFSRERERIMSRMVVRMNVILGNGLIPIKNPPGKSWYSRTKAIKTPQ